jgi:hypothetical protein
VSNPLQVLIVLAFSELRLILSSMCMASLVGNVEDEQARPLNIPARFPVCIASMGIQ